MRLLVAVVFIAWILVGNSRAQEDVYEVGVYTNYSPDADHTSISLTPEWPYFQAYLFLFNPRAAVADPMSTMDLWAFQCRVILPDNLVIVGENVACGWSNESSEEGVYQIFCSTNVGGLNRDGTALVTFFFQALDMEPKVIYLAPTSSSIKSNAMGFWTAPARDFPDEAFVTAYPVSGSYDNPVFGVNTEVVPTDIDIWGSVKALYR